MLSNYTEDEVGESKKEEFAKDSRNETEAGTDNFGRNSFEPNFPKENKMQINLNSENLNK